MLALDHDYGYNALNGYKLSSSFTHTPGQVTLHSPGRASYPRVAEHSLADATYTFAQPPTLASSDPRLRGHHEPNYEPDQETHWDPRETLYEPSPLPYPLVPALPAEGLQLGANNLYRMEPYHQSASVFLSSPSKPSKPSKLSHPPSEVSKMLPLAQPTQKLYRSGQIPYASLMAAPSPPQSHHSSALPRFSSASPGIPSSVPPSPPQLLLLAHQELAEVRVWVNVWVLGSVRV